MTEDRQSSLTAARRRNALSIDVEDYFHAEALSSLRSEIGTARVPERFEPVTHRLLDILAREDVKATFFVLGWVAARAPKLVRRIVEDGHELACHSFAHVRVGEQTEAAFREDLRRAKGVLEEAGGVAIIGYRAPTFSINAETLWAYSVLVEEGFAYSSSVYPVSHDLYGMPGAARVPHRPLDGSSFVEIPMSTVKKGGRVVQGGGGGYFRLLPYGLSARLIRQVNKDEGQPFIFYMHPWEIDTGQPRFSELPLKSRVRHYSRLGAMEAKLGKLLKGFAWGRMDDVYGDVLRSAQGSSGVTREEGPA